MVKQNLNLETMSLDELWSLHEEICAILSARILVQKRQLEDRLSQLNPGALPVEFTEPSGGGENRKERRKYPRVVPRYRNPETAETWAGRGKQPRWLVAAVKAGHSIDHFKIDD